MLPTRLIKLKMLIFFVRASPYLAGVCVALILMSCSFDSPSTEREDRAQRAKETLEKARTQGLKLDGQPNGSLIVALSDACYHQFFGSTVSSLTISGYDDVINLFLDQIDSDLDQVDPDIVEALRYIGTGYDLYTDIPIDQRVHRRNGAFSILSALATERKDKAILEMFKTMINPNKRDPIAFFHAALTLTFETDYMETHAAETARLAIILFSASQSPKQKRNMILICDMLVVTGRIEANLSDDDLFEIASEVGGDELLDSFKHHILLYRASGSSLVPDVIPER